MTVKKEKPLFSIGQYDVVIIDDHYEDGHVYRGYGIKHKTTQVVEYSTTLLFHAIRWAKQCNENLEAELSDNQMDIDWPKLADIGKHN